MWRRIVSSNRKNCYTWGCVIFLMGDRLHFWALGWSCGPSPTKKCIRTFWNVLKLAENVILFLKIHSISEEVFLLGVEVEFLPYHLSPPLKWDYFLYNYPELFCKILLTIITKGTPLQNYLFIYYQLVEVIYDLGMVILSSRHFL